LSNRPTGRTDAELKKLVEKFETGRLPKYDWSHSAHLTVGAYYILNYGSAEALIRLRAGIRNLNMAHGIENSELNGYHETLTRFWVLVIDQFLAQHRSANPDIEPRVAVTTLSRKFQNRRKLHRDYWSFDIIASVKARVAWVEPDVLPLDTRHPLAAAVDP
jgi:hypothetical protein